MGRSAIIELASAIGHRCYNAAVEIVNYPPAYQQIGATGDCPHCSVKSLFQPVLGGYKEVDGTTWRMCNPAQCQACKRFVLVIGFHTRQQNAPFNLTAVYPLGKPNDAVDATVPPLIAADFREALRCRWVEAYKATVTMCRRTIQGSALNLGASQDKKLVGQIDELASQGKITAALKDFAHEVRLAGNDGAHPDKDGLDSVTDHDADDIIEFTRQFLDHVYVMPARFAARRPKPAATPPVQPAQP